MPCEPPPKEALEPRTPVTTNIIYEVRFSSPSIKLWYCYCASKLSIYPENSTDTPASDPRRAKPEFDVRMVLLGEEWWSRHAASGFQEEGKGR